MKLSEIKDWDWRSVRYIIFIFAFFLVFFFIRANASHFALEYSQRGMNSETQGMIVSREVVKGLNQSTTGSRATIEGINVRYIYTVNDVRYEGEQILAYSFIDRKQLDYFSIAGVPFRVKIKYNRQFPSQSSVSLN